jgi:hypothetical protein
MDDYGPGQGNYSNYLALSAYRYGSWSASANGDGDSWNVSVTIMVDGENGSTNYGPFIWTVWNLMAISKLLNKKKCSPCTNDTRR